MRTKDEAAAVWEALAARGRAVIAGDVSYLDTVLAPELRHIHATGKIEPRRLSGVHLFGQEPVHRHRAARSRNRRL